MNYSLHETAIIDDNVTIGDNTKIWHFSHIQSGAIIGESCSLGQNVNVSNNVTLGNGVKVQNNVSIYEGVTIEDYVFCGPSCVFTNDLTPRARYPKNHKYLPTIVRHDATIGANATIVCGHEVGHHATIAAGAVVTCNVKPHALMAGVPAKQIGWVCECGQVLKQSQNNVTRDDMGNGFVCPDCGREYKVIDGEMISD
ncbi:N-acetyltransferase [Butyrivibrio sp. CB08]|uniref:acyltransferase n=1 Tax=Butyrivibrio sp. CB08 TaxID=2364879 RepID=UPI000EAABF12|nr:acyltransferase [Butyrivibrio sp. CB08]RKM57882.1 N-acetyltransferase [Butyrivibrio sp. CB08]